MKCNDYTSFCARFDRVTGGLAKEIEEVSGIVFAGGSVIGTLTEGTIGDIDIFLTCALEQARSVIERIYSAAQNIDDGCSRKILVTRRRHAVTIHRVRSDGKLAALPIQVILSVYDNVTQLLTGFDIDSCCYGYVPGKGVFATPRGFRALRYGVNIFDSNFENATYCHRLEKWDARGYAIAIPGLVEEKISRRFLEASYFAVSFGHEVVILRGEKQNIGRWWCIKGQRGSN